MEMLQRKIDPLSEALIVPIPEFIVRVGRLR
jgi:hypothetical protein